MSDRTGFSMPLPKGSIGATVYNGQGKPLAFEIPDTCDCRRDVLLSAVWRWFCVVLAGLALAAVWAAARFVG